MKITSKLFAASAFAGLATTAMAGPMVPAEQVEAPPMIVEEVDTLGFTLSAGYDSQYIFRGVDFGDNLAWVGLDYANDFGSPVELSLGMWYAATNGNGDADFTELDLYGGIGFAAGPVDFSLGYIWYYFPNDSDYTGEVYGSIGSEFAGVGLELYYGYDHEIEGGYAALSLGYSFAVTSAIAFDFSTGVSYTHDYNFPSSDWNNWDIRLGMPIALTDTAVLEPYVAGSVAMGGLSDDYFYGGISLAVDF